MDGRRSHSHQPDYNNIIAPIERWFQTHGAQNLVFFMSEAVPEITTDNGDAFIDHYNTRFQHRGQYGWRYMLVGHYDVDTTLFGYVDIDRPDGVFIADQRIRDYIPSWWLAASHAKLLRQVIMHETAHTVGIIVLDYSCSPNPCEVYNPQPYSVMARVVAPGGNGACMEPTQEIDWYYWSLRQMP